MTAKCRKSVHTGRRGCKNYYDGRRDPMALVRCITEMGMGVDVHGLDYTLVAKRAVFDAIHHSSLGFARLVGATARCTKEE